MTNKELFNCVEKAIRTVMRLKEEPISPNTLLIRELGVESIDFLDLSCELEKITEEEINFPEVFKELRVRSGEKVVDLSVADIVDFLQRKVDSKFQSQAASK